MEMQQVRYFLALARTLNFTRAAEECNVTQPALTRAIQSLEAEFGGELLRRERGKSHLTELGKRMQPLLERCYQSALHAKTIASAINNQDLAPLAIAISHTVNLEIAMGAISELFRSLPGVQLKLRHGGSDEIMAMLKDGDVDMALAGPLHDEWDRLDRWALFEEPMELALADRAADVIGSDLTLSKLNGLIVFSQSGCEMRPALLRRFAENGVKLAASHEVVTHHDLAALVDAGLGLAIVPASAPSHPGVRRVQLSDLDMSREVSVYAVAGRQRAVAAAALLNLLRSADYSRVAKASAIAS